MGVQIAGSGNTVATSAGAVALGDADLAVREAAAQVLRMLCKQGDSEVITTLMSYIGYSAVGNQMRQTAHSEHDVQKLAVELLGRIATKQDVEVGEALCAVSRDAQFDEDIRRAAEETLR